MPTVKELQEQVDEQAVTIQRLTGQLAGLMAMVGVPQERVEPEERADHIEHGSDQHATLIGLVKATEDDPEGHEGWKLSDLTMFGPRARPEYLKEVLRQKVSTLKNPMPTVQSDDPRKPDYAPPMWRPKPSDARVPIRTG